MMAMMESRKPGLYSELDTIFNRYGNVPTDQLLGHVGKGPVGLATGRPGLSANRQAAYIAGRVASAFKNGDLTADEAPIVLQMLKKRLTPGFLEKLEKDDSVPAQYLKHALSGKDPKWFEFKDPSVGRKIANTDYNAWLLPGLGRAQ